MTGFDIALIWLLCGFVPVVFQIFSDWYEGCETTSGEIVAFCLVGSLGGVVTLVVLIGGLLGGLFQFVSYLFSPLNFKIKGRGK